MIGLNMVDSAAKKGQETVPLVRIHGPGEERLRLLNLHRQNSALYIELREKVHQNEISDPINQIEFVAEANLLLRIYWVTSEILKISRQTARPSFRLSNVNYSWNRLFMALKAVHSRFASTEEELKASKCENQEILAKWNADKAQQTKSHFMDMGDKVCELATAQKAEIAILTERHSKDKEKLPVLSKESGDRINQMIPIHKAEVRALANVNAKEKASFSILSLQFSRLLHDMAAHIQDAKKEKVVLITTHAEEISSLETLILRQDSLIETLRAHMQNQTKTAEINMKIMHGQLADLARDNDGLESRLKDPQIKMTQHDIYKEVSSQGKSDGKAEQSVLEQDHAREIQERDAALQHMKQIMERKREFWEFERQQFMRRIENLENKLEEKKSWDEGTQWEVVGKKKKKNVKLAAKERKTWR